MKIYYETDLHQIKPIVNTRQVKINKLLPGRLKIYKCYKHKVSAINTIII